MSPEAFVSRAKALPVKRSKKGNGDDPASGLVLRPLYFAAVNRTSDHQSRSAEKSHTGNVTTQVAANFINIIYFQSIRPYIWLTNVSTIPNKKITLLK